MVRIIAAHTRKGTKGDFIVLEIMGGLEVVQSQNTGRFYATARKAFISTTFDEATAKSFIGQTLPGTLERVSCEPFTYEIPGTKEEITLSHTYTYLPQEEKSVESEGELFEEYEAEHLRSGIQQY